MGGNTFMFKFTDETRLRTIFNCNFEALLPLFVFIPGNKIVCLSYYIVNAEQNLTFMTNSTSEYYNIFVKN